MGESPRGGKRRGPTVDDDCRQRVGCRLAVAVLIGKITTDFPDRPVAFLTWARNSGLLRVDATAYRFRHQTYRQWILNSRPDEELARSTPEPPR